MKKIVVIGGVAGGATAAARLRRLDEHAAIVVLERGGHVSFANCGLPYHVGGVVPERESLLLQTPESFKRRFNVDVKIRHEALSIDRAAKTVSVKNLATGETHSEPYDTLLLAPGATPVISPVEGADSEGVFSVRDVADADKITAFLRGRQPRHATIIGGGFIGVEMAENLRGAGLDVALVELSNQVLAPFDPDMACEIHQHLRQHGVALHLGNSLRKITPQPNGAQRVELQQGEFETGLLVMAVGVKPESGLAKSAGLDLNARGGIVVDKHMRTSDPAIYAVGDAVEVVDFTTGQPAMVPLAGPANKQARVAADHICGVESEYTGAQGSAVVKVFDMTAASTGVNEKTAKRLGLECDKIFLHLQSRAGYYPGAKPLSMKVLFAPSTGKILGAQATGFDGVEKRCDVLATALRAGMTARDLARLDLCYAPPYSSAKDPVNMAGCAIDNLLSGRVKHFHWHDVDALPRDGSATLLDVRTPEEYANGHLDGFINLPLDDLRGKCASLATNKKIYLTCRVGLRGYIAARILTQHGFDVFNLDGGYRLYLAQSSNGFQPLKIENKINNNILPSKTENKKINACGLQCPGPILKLSSAMKEAADGETLEITTTDPAFASDIEGYCRRTGNVFLGMSADHGVATARVKKASGAGAQPNAAPAANGKNFIVFSGDLDKALAAFIMANASAAMGRKTSMFFTFWGLNIVRKPEKVRVKKDFLSRMFGRMMPRGARKLGLSKMNMAGMGAAMIRHVMKGKNVDSLEALIASARANGVELVACSMSMDVMGIRPEELLDGVTLGGAAAMLAHAEESDMSLFI